MTLKKYFLIFTVVCLAGSVGKAQSVEPKISFEKTIHDFSDIKESDGKVSYEFKFTNVGSKPLVINDVKASCGCTTPTWTKNPILPGGNGFVKAEYNPAGRPGSFNKSITVSSNDPTNTTVLRIAGNVLQGEKSIEQRFPYNMGALRLEYINLSMMTMTTKEKNTKEIKIINTSDSPMKLGFKDVPEAILAVANPSTLQAGQEGVISITYDASKKNDYDYVRDWFYVKINGKDDYGNRLMVTAKIEEDFSSLSDAEKANAPIASFPNPTFNFGTVKEGEVVKYEFPVVNEGKSNLIIRKLKTTCGCTAALPKKSIIAPGEKTYISVTFNSQGKKGDNYKPITVITNSPTTPSETLAIRGVVE